MWHLLTPPVAARTGRWVAESNCSTHPDPSFVAASTYGVVLGVELGLGLGVPVAVVSLGLGMGHSRLGLDIWPCPSAGSPATPRGVRGVCSRIEARGAHSQGR